MKTKTYILLFALLIFETSFGKEITYVIPKSSKFTGTQHAVIPTVNFTGQEIISGEFQVTHNKHRPDYPVELYFYPNEESYEKLPYLKVRGINKATKINISNSIDAANLLLGKEVIETILSGKVEHYSGESTILIKSFSAGVECDTIFFRAEMVKEIQKHNVVRKTLLHKHVGC